AWLARHEPDQETLARMRSEALRWTFRPLISVVMPVFNPELQALEIAISSVLGQTYPYWELRIVDDGSTIGGVRDRLKTFADADPRVKLRLHDANAGIVA